MSQPQLRLHTARLVLRRWRPSDRQPFAAMNADPVVVLSLIDAGR